MSRQDRLTWISRGSPFTLMRPAAKLRDRLRAHGYTVYDIGNQDHLEHEPPEDHTPYSETGWPGNAKYGVGYAIDIMPPKSGQRSKVTDKPLPSLQALGLQMYRDRNAGVLGIAWLKYMNWEPERNYGGPCYQDSWKPTHRRRSSSDRGHIHLSGLTGYETSSIGDGYDPVARLQGEDDDMTPAELLAAMIRNPITGKLASVETFLVSINNEAYKARLTAEAALAAVQGVDDEGIKALIRDTATADAQRDAELPAQVLAALPDGSGPVSREDLVAALTTVFGSLDGATPPPPG